MKVTSLSGLLILWTVLASPSFGKDFKAIQMSEFRQRLIERVKLGTIDERIQAIQECGVSRPGICYYALIDLLSDESPIIRERAAISVGLLRNIDALPHIQKALDTEKDEKVQVSLLRGLSFFRDENATKIAEKFLINPSDAIRFNVGKVLCAKPDDSFYPNIAEQIKVEKVPKIKVMLLRAALQIKKNNDYIIELIRYFTDTDPLVRLYAARAASDLKLKDALLPLHKAILIEPDGEVLDEFFRAYNYSYMK
ncbi:MAG: HEAT repeat domain-containing protein [Spirochaetia bacterium]|nr:HEAT repeat domain-containing protein [Spirochaetia bacterium]